MARKVDCYDIIDGVVQEATQQFASLFKVNEQSYAVLKQYCDIIDSISDDCGGIAYEVAIDEITTKISIAIICESLTVGNPEYMFYKLADKAESVRFSVANMDDDDYLSVEFVFPGIWEKI